MCDADLQTNLITERDYGLRYVNFICYKIQCIMCGIINVLLMRHLVTDLASHSLEPLATDADCRTPAGPAVGDARPSDTCNSFVRSSL